MCRILKWFRKPEKRITWPTPEVDYEGNQMWANAFPKPRTYSQGEMLFFKGMQAMQEAGWAQYRAAQGAHASPYYFYPQGKGLLNQVFGNLGI